MIILACETSTLLGSVALIKDGQVLARSESMRQGSHSDIMNKFISEVFDKAGLSLADVDLFVTGIGPGSFTGIRISLNTVKTFAYCYQKPVVGVNSLEALAYQAAQTKKPPEFLNFPIISIINAYKNMCYVATYQAQNEQIVCINEPSVVRVQKLNEYVTQNSLICGDGYSTYHKFFPQDLSLKLHRVESLSDEPHATSLAHLAGGKTPQQWGEILPLYIRASEAEENLQGIKYQPLI